MTLVNIADLSGPNSATVQHYEVAETVTPWYPLPPEEVTQSIGHLQVALNAGNWEQVDNISVYLSLSIQAVGAADTPLA